MVRGLRRERLPPAHRRVASQGLHYIFLFGHHNMTVSARCYVEYRLLGNERWRRAHDGINWVFLSVFGQHEHCMKSFLSDEHYARQVLSLKQQSSAQS